MKINRGHHPYIQRILSLLLVFSLVFGMITPAFAQEAAAQGSSAPQVSAQADQAVQTQTDQTVQTQADQAVQTQSDSTGAAASANPADVAPRSVTQENGVEVVRFDYQSSEVNVLVTLKNPEDLPADAVLSVTPVALDNTAQAKVDSEVKKDNRSIQSQKTFDIKFLQNGKEVEPGSTVKVTITLPDMPANTKAEVLHVSDDSQTVENTNAQTAADGKLQLETNSFSRYVIVNYAQNAIKVNVERYVLDEKKPNDYNLAKLTYRFDKEISGVGDDGTMEQVVTYDLNNYDCKKIVQVVDGKESDIALSGNGKVNIRAEKNMTLKMLSDKLATFGGLVEAEGTLAYSTDEEYKFAYIGFGYNLGISEDKFVDLYIEFVDKDGNIIEDRALIDDNSIVKAIAVYEEDIDDIVNQGGAAYDNTYVAPIISTPLRVKFNINSDKLYETFLGRDSFYFHSNKIGTLLHINNEKSYVAKNSNYTLITCPDTTYDTWVNGVVLVIN